MHQRLHRESQGTFETVAEQERRIDEERELTSSFRKGGKNLGLQGRSISWMQITDSATQFDG
jgi:hypothetical protein